jgi:hypothetical protein
MYLGFDFIIIVLYTLLYVMAAAMNYEDIRDI